MTMFIIFNYELNKTFLKLELARQIQVHFEQNINIYDFS